MALVETEDLISISDANKLGLSALVRDAEHGHARVVLRNNKAVAVVMSMDRFARLQEMQDDLIDITLAASRMMTTGAERHTLDDVLAHFGYSRHELAELPD
jgi:prevent-host-death family protein